MLRNRAIIGGVVFDSPLLSAPAEAVEAIHGVMSCSKAFLRPLLTT